MKKSHHFKKLYFNFKRYSNLIKHFTTELKLCILTNKILHLAKKKMFPKIESQHRE